MFIIPVWKWKKKSEVFFLLWDNILSSFGRTLDSTHFFQRYHPVTFMPLAMQNLRTFWGFFFLLCIEIWQPWGASQRWNPWVFFSYLLLTLFKRWVICKPWVIYKHRLIMKNESIIFWDRVQLALLIIILSQFFHTYQWIKSRHGIWHSLPTVLNSIWRLL